MGSLQPRPQDPTWAQSGRASESCWLHCKPSSSLKSPRLDGAYEGLVGPSDPVLLATKTVEAKAAGGFGSSTEPVLNTMQIHFQHLCEDCGPWCPHGGMSLLGQLSSFCQTQRGLFVYFHLSIYLYVSVCICIYLYLSLSIRRDGSKHGNDQKEPQATPGRSPLKNQAEQQMGCAKQGN